MDSDPLHSAQRQRQKKKRSRFGCNTCRSRKVKCDERPNGCANCERLHLECSGYHQSVQRPDASDIRAPRSKRVYRSCNACRVARTKCSGERPTCAACRELSRLCSFGEITDLLSASSPHCVEVEEAPTTPNTSDVGSSQNHFRWTSLAPGPTEEDRTPHLPWLTSTDLPDHKHVRVLVAHYFQNFHPLRCFAFIHKPSFLRDLDGGLASGSQSNALLHITCTLGAQFYALEHSDTVQKLPDAFILQAGCHWAKTALSLLLQNMEDISVERLMAAQLLYDYALRQSNFSQAFMLSALMARMTQALQINLEYSADLLGESPEIALSVTTRECRRRLMWSCYVTDALCGSGVDQLTLIDERDIKIQLPCNDANFFAGLPCITKTLNNLPLAFLPSDVLPADATGNIGILAYFIQHIGLRKRVLRYIKHLDSAMLPWLPNSEFEMLSGELKDWYQSLPPNLQFNTSSIYMRKESNQLGALCLLHCAFHQTMCDLYRLGTPALYKLRSAFSFPPEQKPFQKRLQWTLFDEARTLAIIIATTEQHGPRMLADSWLPTITYDSNRIMLYFLAQEVGCIENSTKEVVLKTIPLLWSNLAALKTMKATNAVADGLSRAAETMMEKLGVATNSILPRPNLVLDDPYLTELGQIAQSGPGSPVQRTPDYVLNPLSIYRMARKGIPERHAPGMLLPPSIDTRPERRLSSANELLDLSSIGDQPSQLGDVYGAFEGLAPNLDIFFNPNSTWNWQPPETVLESAMENNGLAPWVGALQLADFNYRPVHRDRTTSLASVTDAAVQPAYVEPRLTSHGVGSYAR